MIRSSSKLSKIFLAAMVHELYKTGMGETTFEKVSHLCPSQLTFVYIQVIITSSVHFCLIRLTNKKKLADKKRNRFVIMILLIWVLNYAWLSNRESVPINCVHKLT